MNNIAWPKLDYQESKDTYETLHRWLQIVGKLRLNKSPWINHSWQSTFYVTSRGLTTSAIPLGDKNITVDFDFVDHKVIFTKSDGLVHSFDLTSESVSEFYRKFCVAMKKMEVEVTIDTHPNECNDYLSFNEDREHCTYNKEHAHRLFQVFVRVNNVLLQFRSRFLGKCSPVHLFWGSFDLAVTRFSGRPAPEHPGVAPHISKEVMKEAYSHEVSSCGFWPGNEWFPQAAFYSYAYPISDGFAETGIEPANAFYHKELGEFILTYDDVRKSLEPERILLDFFQSTYEAAAILGKWDRVKWEESIHMHHLQALHPGTLML